MAFVSLAGCRVGPLGRTARGPRGGSCRAPLLPGGSHPATAISCFSGGDNHSEEKLSLEVAKLITKSIAKAEDWRDIRTTLSHNADFVNVRHLTTALYFITKKNRHDLKAYVDTSGDLLEDLSWVTKKLLEFDAHEWSPASLTNVIQACEYLSGADFEHLRATTLETLIKKRRVISPREYLTISSCLVHFPDSDEKWEAGKSLGTVFLGQSNIVVDGGIGAFTPGDFGHLSWSLTELRCSPHVASEIFKYCVEQIGLKNLRSSSICLLSRMISMQGSCAQSESHLTSIVSCLISDRVLRRMSSLKDSSMLLLSIARLVRAHCEQGIVAHETSSSGLKWTVGVNSYRKSSKFLGIAVDGLCKNIQMAFESSSKLQEQHVYSSVLYSLALLQYAPSGLLSICLKGLLKNADTLTLRTIATSAWSLSVLRYDDPCMMDAFAGRIIEGGLIKTSSDDISDLQQSVCMILYSFSVLNMFDSSRMGGLLQELMNVAGICLSNLGPESLPIFGWSIVLAHGNSDAMHKNSFKSTMRNWRCAVADNLDNIPKETLALVHHTEIALALEAPSLGIENDIRFDHIMQFMYTSGRVKRSAMNEWNVQQEHTETVDHESLDCVSLFQKEVYRAAERVHSGWIMEYWDDKLQYPVDMALPDRKIVIEADGPTHFTNNTRRPLGATALKRRLLCRLGWNIVSVPYFEWGACSDQKQQYAYMKRRLIPLLADEHFGDQTKESPVKTIDVLHGDKENESKSELDLNIMRKNAAIIDMIKTRQGKMAFKDALARKMRKKNITIPVFQDE